MKKFYRCKVCGDIHFGMNAPKICPTCSNIDSYAAIKPEEAKKAMF